MKAITTDAVIEGLRSRKDKSLGLTISTPELSSKEKAMFMDLQGINIKMLIEPTGEPTEEYKVDRELNQKTKSQVMRNVLYRLWEQDNEDMDSQLYYEKKMDKIIEHFKSKFED